MIGNILYQILRLFWVYFLKKINIHQDIPIELKINRFKIKTGYHLELSTVETMALLESTVKKITRDKNDENKPHLEITKVVLLHSNISNKDYASFFQINNLVKH